MSASEKRPGSITFLLVGLVLLVAAGGLFAALVPCIGCPLERHRLDGYAHFVRACPLCGGDGKRNEVTLWRKISWKPKTPEERQELPLQERQKPPGQKP